MNGAHFHLLVNHLPIIFPLIGLIVMAVGLISKSEAVKRTAYLVIILGSLSAIIAMTSGEGAEEIAEKLAGVTKEIIERHEEAAELFAIMSYILGALSVLGLWASFSERTFSNMVAIATIAFTAVVLFFATQTGTTGGEIRHTEIRTNPSQGLPAGSEIDNEKDSD